MDLATIIGFAAAIGLVLVGATLEGLHIGALFGPTALIIVVGGTIGATVMSHTKEDLKQLGGALKKTVAPAKLDFAGSVEFLVDMAEKARKGGVLSLQADIADAPHPILQTGLTMAVDGADPDDIMDVLESMIKVQEEKLHHAAAVCDTAGGYCPTLGIMGTVMGLIHVMGNLAEPDTLGPAIAVAFLATFYGVAFANLLFLPWGTKIKLLAGEEKRFGQMLAEGVLGLQTGVTPRNLRERLSILAHTQGDRTSGGTIGNG